MPLSLCTFTTMRRVRQIVVCKKHRLYSQLSSSALLFNHSTLSNGRRRNGNNDVSLCLSAPAVQMVCRRQTLCSSVASFTVTTITSTMRNASLSYSPSSHLQHPSDHKEVLNENQYIQNNSTCNRESVHPELVAELEELIEETPFSQWQPISSLYAQLKPQSRREYVKPHKTLLKVLQIVKNDLSISISSAGVMYCKGTPPPEISNQTNVVAFVNEHGSVDVVEASKFNSEEIELQHNKLTCNMENNNEIQNHVTNNDNTSENTKRKVTVVSLSRYNPHNNNNISTQSEQKSSSLESLFESLSTPTKSTTGKNNSSSSSSSSSDVNNYNENKESPALFFDSFSCNDRLKNVIVDFFYDVELTTFPPAPADFMMTPSARKRAKATEDGSVMSLSTLTHFIPPFFVPMQEVLKNMPGYTEEHIQNYFSSDAIEIVKIEDERFIRFHGGYIKVKLDNINDAEELFAQYKPNVALAEHFIEAFHGVYEKWIALPLLLERTPPEVIAQLPYQGTQAIMYFAQMQHIFAFSVDNAGKAAVLLRREKNTQLTCDTTPTPKLCNFLLRLVPGNSSMDLSTVESSLTENHWSELNLYYGCLIHFFKAHGGIFYLSEDNTVVMRTRYHERMQEASLSLEEQVELALKRHDKAKVRTLRRRIAFRDNPSHPFHDPDNLAREVNRYLPTRGFVTMRHFLSRVIPEEVIFFMPRKVNSFFNNYPQYFVTFEYQRPANWCICAPNQPLPRGVIKQEFNDEDVVRLIATMLQARRNSCACSYLFVNLPKGAQELIKHKHGGMYNFVEKYPQYFSIVLKSDTENEKSSAVVHLIQMPNMSDSNNLLSSSSSSSQGNSGHADTNYYDGRSNGYEDEYGDGI